ncbi:MAG: AI-2E family transporter [Armatimonadetes bacterium]|nr:AI-2E family transporter [Armatimonadota bacterium]
MNELDRNGEVREDLRLRYQYYARLLLLGISAVFIILLLARLRNILIIFYFALLVSLAINPAILWLERHRVPRLASVPVLALMTLAAVFGAFLWFVPLIVEQTQGLIQDLPYYLSEAQVWINRMVNRYPFVRTQIEEYRGEINQAVLQAGGLVQQLGSWLMSFGSALFILVLVFFLVIFGLINPLPMAKALFELTPADQNERVERAISSIQEKTVAWAGGTLLVMALVGTISWAGLTFLGVPQAFLFGVIAAIGEFIPTVGPILSMIPPFLVMLLIDPVKALGVLALYITIQQLENHLLTPVVFGNRLEVHPWGLIFMILVMGDLFGLLGVLLATPTTAIMGVLYDEFVPKPGTKDSVPILVRVSRVIGGERHYREGAY